MVSGFGIHGVPQLWGRPSQTVIGPAAFAFWLLSPSVELVQAFRERACGLGVRLNHGGKRPLTRRSTGRQKRTAFGSLRCAPAPVTSALYFKGGIVVSVNQVERAYRAWPILIKRAESRSTSTYGELGQALGVHHRAIRYVLGVIKDYCLEEGLPPLTILIINASGRPGWWQTPSLQSTARGRRNHQRHRRSSPTENAPYDPRTGGPGFHVPGSCRPFASPA